MKTLIQYRHSELICRQRAVFDFEHSSHWLAEAEMWANKAQDEISAHFRECNSANSIFVAEVEKPKIAA